MDDLQGRMPLERRMRSVGVVLDSVLFSQQLGLLHRGEQLDVQTFIPEPAGSAAACISPFPRASEPMVKASEDVLAFRHFPPPPALEEGLEHQPARARQRGDQATHPRRGHLSQRRCDRAAGGRCAAGAERALAARGPADVLSREHGRDPSVGGPAGPGLLAGSNRLNQGPR